MIVAKEWQAKACHLSFISVLAFCHTIALAQETDLQEKQRKEAGSEKDGKFGSDTIVVTGQSFTMPDEAMPLPVIVLSGEELVHRRRGTLGETLDGLPGVHMDNFGAGASRPVIRGQTLPRIEILSDGANLFDAASVSPDHAVVTDPLLLDAIEIQRGPAAIRYGGSAVNGAVNLIDSKVPKALPEGGFTGAYEMRYGTADNEMTAAGRTTVALGPIALHAEGSYSDRENYNVPKAFGSGKLKDSFANTSSYALGASWVTGKGYIGASYTRQNAEYGLPGHSHSNNICHTHGFSLHCAGHGIYTDRFPFSNDHSAYINLRSERVDVRGDFTDLLPGFEHVRLRGSYTDYVHDEIDGPVLFSRYTNKVWDGRIELTHKPILGFVGTFGVQYTDGVFSGLNVNDLHKDVGFRDPRLVGKARFFTEGLYHTENIGIFLSERRSFGPIDIELAFRHDWREIQVRLPEGGIPLLSCASCPLPFLLKIQSREIENFKELNPDAKHNPFSASIGATWNIANGYSVALSLAHTERAPNVRELYAYGNNLATNSYELGLTQATRATFRLPEPRPNIMESADSINLTLRKVGGPLEFEIGAFYQDVDNYIFARLLDTDARTGLTHNYIIYTASDAEFFGLDGQISYRLSPEMRATVFGDYVDTTLKIEEVSKRLKKIDDNLPRIPPGRLGTRLDWASGPLSADVEYYHTFKQNKVALYETPTKGYNMVNATIAYRFEIPRGGELELYARGTNLTNELAFVHTSFVKDQSPLRGRGIVLGLRHRF